MRQLLRYSIAFIGLLSLGPMALGQSSETKAASAWRSVEAGAVKEGKVVLYTMLIEATSARMKKDFESAYPQIKLDYHRVPGTAFVRRIEEEQRSGNDSADLVITTLMLWLEDRARAGAFRVLFGPSAEAWPRGYLVGGTGVVLSIEPLVMAYNHNLIKRPVTGYQDLLRSELQGRLGTSELVAPSVIAWYDWLEKTQGPDFLGRFAGQHPKVYTGGIPATQAVASGEIALAAFAGLGTAKALVEQGAPITIVVPKPSLGVQYGGAVLAGSRRPNAALVLMDYLMSRRGQTAWHGQGESASPLPNIPGSVDGQSIVPYDEKPYTPEFIKARREAWNKLFKPQ